MSEPQELFPVDQVVQTIREGGRTIELTGVDGEVCALFITELQERLGRPILVVTPDDSEARRRNDDLQFTSRDPGGLEYLPTIDASPYGDLSPDRGGVLGTLASLGRLAWDMSGAITVTSATTLIRKVMPPEVLVDHSYLVATGEDLDRSECLRTLADAGYRSVGVVEDPGTFAVRGGIIDVFAPHMTLPARIELWGDEVESIKLFDISSQRTTDQSLEQLILSPVREELFVQDNIKRARKGIMGAAAEVDMPTRKMQPILDDLTSGIPFMGVEGYRPAFYETMGTLFDYLPADVAIVLLDPMGVLDRCRQRWESLQTARQRAQEEGTPSLAPETHAIPPNTLAELISGHTVLRCHRVQMVDQLGAVEGPEDAIRFFIPRNTHLTNELSAARADQVPLKPLATWVRQQTAHGVRTVLSCRQETQLDRVERILKNYGVPVTRSNQSARRLLQPPEPGEAGAVLVRGEIQSGFQLLSRGIALVTEQEIFGRRAPKRRSKRSDPTSPFVQDFRELKPGDLVVHADHGIGRYTGLKKLSVGPFENDFLMLEFAGTDKLYLPVYALGRLQKYSGGGQSSPRVDKLGGTAWQKVRERAKKSAEEDALAMLDLYARREMAVGHRFSEPDDFFRAFEGTFPFEETPDQARAIDEVLADMCRPRPMDRLLCGDVGFGKTEVALRAAMKAVLDGKQVSVLVPTTVLALQHFRTFTQRFQEYAVETRLFSRLVPSHQLKQNTQALAAGKIDIAVGTHKLLSKDIEYADLGLLILDEEHRFGVKHKETLKSLRANVDVLAMTATPIPRTLQMSLSGIRDLSVITTPPSDRLSVRTYVCRATDDVVRDAIRRELSRGGQIFFVHNRVHSIESRAAWIASLVPEARIVIGHGQMDPAKLERVMIDFTEGRFNILISTTIIESGIDIPTANTMLVDQADRLGLAQLYQLRGRVGRGQERGYCYLLVPGEVAIDREARARLAVIQKFTELGSGFHVASHDLELRGSGDLLGTRQKGHVQAVGLDLYSQLLDEAVRTLRGQAPKAEVDPEINIQLNARIPDDYVPDTALRLMLYKRLANAVDEERVLAISMEMEDRFGEPPPSLGNLVEIMRIRTLAKTALVQVVDHSSSQGVFTFHPQTPIGGDKILGLIRLPNSQWTVPSNYRLTYRFDSEERKNTVRSLRIALQVLAEFVTEDNVEEQG